MTAEALDREQTPEEVVVARVDAFLGEGKHLIPGAHVIEISKMPRQMNLNGERSVVHLALNKVRLRAKRKSYAARIDVGSVPDTENAGFRILRIHINILRK